jgi:hypothetical protein
MGDFLYGYVLGRVIFGIPILAFKLTRFVLRIAWWLGLWAVLSVGAGLMSITRAGKANADETAGFGRFTEDGALWRDKASGLEFPCSDTELCEIHAGVAGQYWRRTALSRLVRATAIWRYRFDAVTDGAGGIAATHEFTQEARVNLTLDTVDPAQASTDQYGQGRNRDWAVEALMHMDWLLTNRAGTRSASQRTWTTCTGTRPGTSGRSSAGPSRWAQRRPRRRSAGHKCSRSARYAAVGGIATLMRTATAGGSGSGEGRTWVGSQHAGRG